MNFDELRKTPGLSKSQIENAAEAVKDFRYVERDFEFQVARGTTPSNFQGLNSFVTTISVKYKPTGKKREYREENFSAWAVPFKRDLQMGYFKS